MSNAVLKLLTIATLIVSANSIAAAQDASKPEPIDGVARPARDTLLDQLIGHWQVNRVMGGTASGSTVDASWVLNHQFVQLHYVPDRGSKQPYEAIVYIGYDNMSERYVMHWLDIFGGRWSEPIGFGARNGNAIRFVVEYPDGPFTNTFTFDSSTRTWSLLLRQKNPRGEWETFATEQWQRTR